MELGSRAERPGNSRAGLGRTDNSQEEGDRGPDSDSDSDGVLHPFPCKGRAQAHTEGRESGFHSPLPAKAKWVFGDTSLIILVWLSYANIIEPPSLC